MKNRKYMQSEEFKERQGSFEFFCAKAYEFLMKFKTECRSGWKKIFAKAVKKQEQIAMAFTPKPHLESVRISGLRQE